MTARVLALCLYLGIIHSTYTHAQKKSLNFDHIYEEKEFFEIYVVKKDSRGFIWAGTQHGLFRYDGYSLKKFPTILDSINRDDTPVMGIYEDEENIFWVATHEGLVKINFEKGYSKLFAPDSKKKGSLNARHCSYVTGGRDGIIWVSTLAGINKFDTRTEIFSLYKYDDGTPNSPSNYTKTLCLDTKGDLWIGTGNGLNKFDIKKNEFSRYYSDPTNAESLSHNNINDIIEDGNALWISTENGLNKFNRDSGKFKQYFFNEKKLNISSISKDKRGHFWISSSETGLYDFDPVKETHIRYAHQQNNSHSPQSDIVLSSYVDNTELLWLGFRHGLDMVDLNNKKFETYFVEHNDIGVSGLYQARPGLLWIAHEGILSELELKSGKEIYRFSKPELFGKGSYSLTMDKYGWLWFNTFEEDQSLRKFHPETKKFTIYKRSDTSGVSHTFVWTIYKDKHGDLWIGGDHGLNKYEFDKDEFKKYFHKNNLPSSLSDDGVGPVCQAADGAVWVGTINGLNKLNEQTGKFERFYNDPNNNKSLSDNTVTSIYEDKNGNIWVGTRNGLNKYNTGKKSFDRYNVSDNNIYSIYEDSKDNLWIGTATSLTRLNTKNFITSTFNNRDGLPKHFGTFNYTYGPEGDLFFANTEGVIAIHPDEIKLNKNIPPIVITDFQVFNKSVIPGKNSLLKLPISVTKELSLSPKDSYFSFEFAALNYIIPEKNQYAYMMEGYEKNWHYVGNNRVATYSNLEPGHYTFKVKGSNNDGLWNQTGTSISIHILPSFWQTWWFKLLEAILLICFLYVLYKLRTNRTERKFKEKEILKDKINKELEEKILERTAALNNANIQIEKMNSLLKLDNKKLETDVDNISKARVMQKMITYEEFEKIYPNDDACYQYLYDLKWKNGYMCRKCGGLKFAKGPIPYSLKCNRCAYIETVTAHTIFNKLKFPIIKAMYILTIIRSGHKITTKNLSEILNLRSATCLSFVNKVKEVMINTKPSGEKNDLGYLILSDINK